MPFARPVFGNFDVVKVNPTVSNRMFVDAAGAVKLTSNISFFLLKSIKKGAALTVFNGNNTIIINKITVLNIHNLLLFTILTS